MYRSHLYGLITCFMGVFCTSAQAADTYIHAGTLLAVPGNEPLSEQTIVLYDGVIQDIMAGYLEPKNRESTVIDLRDRFVMPGLMDLHVHLTMEPTPREFMSVVSDSSADLAMKAAKNARTTLMAGITTVVDLGRPGTPAHEEAIFAVRDAIDQGLAVGPKILATGTPISTTGQERQFGVVSKLEPVVVSRAVCDGEAACRNVTRALIKRGADIISFYSSGSLLFDDPSGNPITETEMRAIVETAHALGRKVIADGHHAPGVAAALRAGVDSVDSVHYPDGDTFKLVRQRDAFLQSHIYAITASVGDTPATLEDGIVWWHPHPVLERLYEIKMKPFTMIEAYKADVKKLAFASDAGNFPHGDNTRDLIEFVERGIPASVALQTATINAAKLLGVEAERGTLEPGKTADIIALDGDPLADIRAILNVTLVIRDGQVYKLH